MRSLTGHTGIPSFPGFTPQARTILNAFTVSAGTQRSENCLTLNIWSKPSSKSGERKKPVFVLFHGGRFAGGNTSTPFANGQYLANNTDIIVVPVNYRLNIFGFPGSLNIDTNLGLRDQRLAVQWLQKNIHVFGGDSKKIAIAGQSSGGAAVDWWTYAYAQDPIIHGLISTSGNAFSFPKNSAAKQAENWSLISSLHIPLPRFGGEIRTPPVFHGHNDNEQGYYVIPVFAQGRNVTAEQVQKFLLE
ncbi:hypothetical protein CFE70_005425 [Pyrenophora teres f. teres 0-1]